MNLLQLCQGFQVRRKVCNYLISNYFEIIGCETDTLSNKDNESKIIKQKISVSKTINDISSVNKINDKGERDKIALEKYGEKKEVISKFTETDFVNKNVTNGKLSSQSLPNGLDGYSAEGTNIAKLLFFHYNAYF